MFQLLAAGGGDAVAGSATGRAAPPPAGHGEQGHRAEVLLGSHQPHGGHLYQGRYGILICMIDIL